MYHNIYDAIVYFLLLIIRLYVHMYAHLERGRTKDFIPGYAYLDQKNDEWKILGGMSVTSWKGKNHAKNDCLLRPSLYRLPHIYCHPKWWRCRPKKTADYYAKRFGFNLTPEEINCDRCLSEGGKLIGYCQTCEIRKCCREKELDNCSICEDQPCEKLQEFHHFSPEAKATFQSLLENQSGWCMVCQL